MTGHQDDTLKTMIAGMLTNVILNAFLIPRWDIAGAAIATGASLMLWNVLLVILVRRPIRDGCNGHWPNSPTISQEQKARAL